MRTLKWIVLLVVLSVVPSLSALGQNNAIDSTQASACPNRVDVSGEAITQEQADCSARLAQARELVVSALNNLDNDAELSTLLAMQAVRETYTTDGFVLAEANTVLHQAAEELRASSTRIPSATFPSNWTVNFMFSEDGTRIIFPVSFDITGGDVGVTGVADVASGDLLLTVPGDILVPSAIGEQVVTLGLTDDGAVLNQWDIASGASAVQIKSVPIPFELVDWTDFSSDLRYGVNVSPQGRTTEIWNLETGEKVETPAITALSGVNGYPLFSKDASLMGNRNADGSVSILETTNWTEAAHLAYPDVPILSYNFAPDSQSVLTAYSDDWVSVWDVESGEEIYTVLADGSPKRTALSEDGTRLAIQNLSNLVTVYDTQLDEAITHFTAPTSNWMTFSPDGSQLATINYDGSVTIWNLDESFGVLTMVNSAADPDAGPLGVAYSPDGTRVVAASVTETPIVWDAETGEKVLTLNGHTARALTVAWSTSGDTIASAGEDTDVILWNAETGEALRTLSGHEDSIYAVAFSPDSTRVASSSYDGTVKIWDVATGDLLQTFEQVEWSKGVAWSPDGTRIAAGTNIADGNSHLVIWEVETGETVVDISVGDTRMGAVAFSPDGTHILGGTLEGQAAKVWDAQSGELLLNLNYHTNLVGGVAYSPDGTQIATGSHDGTIRLWDAETGEELLKLVGAPEGIPRLAFSPDGTRLATANEDGTTRIFVIDIDEMLALAESRLTRTLTDAECQRYLHVEVCPAA